MLYEAIKGIFIPFLGTSLGAACVLFMKNGLSNNVGIILFAFGFTVMMALDVALS
jgi:zinc transporter